VNKSLAFFGRKREIDDLRALHGLRRHVLIVGPAGIGKSALLQRVRRELSLFVTASSDNSVGTIASLMSSRAKISYLPVSCAAASR
jgi:AAA+ ATPase superfamily predicted ATPase